MIRQFKGILRQYDVDAVMSDVVWEQPEDRYDEELGWIKPRPQSAYGDGGEFEYTGKVMRPRPFALAPILQDMRLDLCTRFYTNFDFVLCAQYPDGDTYVPFHHDTMQGPGSMVASVSLGAPRIFRNRCDETGEISNYITEHGDVIVFDYDSQQTHMHDVPTVVDDRLRINLTFRTIGHK